MRRTYLALAIALCGSVATAAFGAPADTPQPPAPAAATEAPAKTIRVDCDQGQKIGDHLPRSFDPVEIAFTGTCSEQVRISRDQVTLRGAAAGATINGTVVIEGASGVRVEDLAIRKGEEGGLLIRLNSGVVVSNVTIEDTGARAILVEGSSAVLRDITMRRTGKYGIHSRTSRVELQGSIYASDCTVAGIGATEAAAFFVFEPTVRIVLEKNEIGLVSQLASEISLAKGTTIASHNKTAGILVTTQGVLAHGRAAIEATNNGKYGLWVDEVGSFATWTPEGATLNFSNNSGPGIMVERDSTLELSAAATVANNSGPGLVVDGGTARIGGTSFAGNGGGDITLSFGARVTFSDGNRISGPVSCDKTVLVRGTTACPERSEATEAPAAGSLVRDVREALHGM